MSEKRYKTEKNYIIDTSRNFGYYVMDLDEIVARLNNLTEENQLLKNKLKQIDLSLPLYLDCAEIPQFRSETFEEDLALNKHYKRVTKEEYGLD